MTRMYPLLLLCAALLAWASASCQQIGPVPIPSTPPAMPPPVASAARAKLLEPVSQGEPGSRVVWREAAVVRTPPAGVGSFLAEVESRLPVEMGMQYRDKRRITWCHETTHGVHAALRNRHHLPAFYPGGGKFALVEPPAITLGEVAAVVPTALRGNRYQTYLVKQRRDWDREPLYVWDEWVAYDNGTTTGLEEGEGGRPGATDDAVACLELSGYALAVAAAARRKGVPVSEQFREFLAWELRRSSRLYSQAIALPAFAWHDRRLERVWRSGDSFVTQELAALYGNRLTVRDLLPQQLVSSQPPPAGF